MTLVGPGTWAAARAAVDCALTAVDRVAAGARAAYALCRPPGHHVTRSAYGGSCYLNNAAVAAQALRARGHERVAVVDVDAHHGNGTASIFYDRADVFYGSVHVDPGAGWFPHVVGFADETGAGRGCRRDAERARSPPRPATGPGSRAWRASRMPSRQHGSTALVVSLGVDAAARRPRITAAGHARWLRPRGRAPPRPRPADGDGPGGRLPPATSLGGLVAGVRGAVLRTEPELSRYAWKASRASRSRSTAFASVGVELLERVEHDPAAHERPAADDPAVDEVRPHRERVLRREHARPMRLGQQAGAARVDEQVGVPVGQEAHRAPASRRRAAARRAGRRSSPPRSSRYGTRARFAAPRFASATLIPAHCAMSFHGAGPNARR